MTNNSSKNPSYYARKITKLGLKITKEKVFTSGDATAIYIIDNHTNSNVSVFGTSQLNNSFREYAINISTNNPDVVVLGFDTTLTYKKLCALCDFVRAGLPYIATHPDFNCPTENGFIPDIGSMIAFVKASTGRDHDIIIGKPNRFIVDSLTKKLNLSINELAMIGDRLYTDIALGNSSGITTCLVLSGETKIEEVKQSIYQPDYIFSNLKEIGDWLVKYG